MLSSNYLGLMNAISKIKPTPKPRNYFEVLQHLKSNDGNIYGRHCIGTLIKNKKNPKGKMYQYWIRPNDSVKRHISLRHDCYITVNTFKRGGSLMKNRHTGQKYHWYHHSDNLVTGLCGLYADLDAKNIGLKYGSQLETIYLHLLDIADLPRPSFVVDSGHGIHILWLFNSEVVIHKHKILQMWQKVEDLFVNRLAKASLELLGTSKLVDAKVHDATRYLRVPTTYNCKDSKHRIYVKTLADNHISYSFTGHRSGLYYKYISQYSKKWVDNLFVDEKRLQAKCHNNKLNEIASTSHVSSNLAENNKSLGKCAYLLINRIADYKEIIKLRNDSHRYTGYRNDLIFIYAVDRNRLRGKHSLLHDAETINNRFHNPLSLGELEQILRIKGHHEYSLSKYHYTNAMIISKHHLGISPREQRHMRTLIGNAERKRRKRIINHKSSLRCHNWRKQHGLIGNITKSKWRRKKLMVEAKGLLKSHTQSDVAHIIGVSRRTLIRWVKKDN